jgi:uncharacterized BrkB/YihY/UPF0761 family membrane protein
MTFIYLCSTIIIFGGAFLIFLLTPKGKRWLNGD